MNDDQGEAASISSDAARRTGLAAREAMTSTEFEQISDAIVDALMELPELTVGARVAGYWPHRREVDLRRAWHSLHDRGLEVHLPRVGDPGATDTAGSMGFVLWEPTSTLEPNRWGIPEPDGAGRSIGHMDVVVLPATSLDRTGNRTGMGQGYYDRALSDIGGPGSTSPVLIGVAFECQVVPAIDAQPWDVPVDVVLTETGARRARRPR